MTETFAHITDLHIDEQFPRDYGADPKRNWERILNDVRSRNIKRIVFGGDIGAHSSNAWFFDSVKTFDLDLTLGNHDDSREAVKYFSQSVSTGASGIYYSKERGSYKEIFLDSSTGKINEHQFGWLKEQLDTDQDVILYVHHPILALDVEADRQFALEGRDRLQETIFNSGVSVTVFVVTITWKI